VRRWRLRAPGLAVALVAVGMLVAGCGGGGKSPGVANVSTTTTSTAHSSSPANNAGSPTNGGGSPSTPSGTAGHRDSGFAISVGNPQKALTFSQCMRANGVPNFPDPNAQGVLQGSGIDPNSAAFQTAQKACGKYIGGGKAPSPAQQAKAQADALAFSQCMRSHGVSDFPDPTFGSGGAIRISIGLHGQGGSDLDPNSPIFQKAQKTCQPLMQAGLPGAKAAP
jgi:hypothetical protein